MPNIKKNEKCSLKAMKKLLVSLETISKRILLFGCVVTTLAYLSAFFTVAFKDALFPDVSTALFWGGELLNLGKELLGATFVPVLLFELLLIICRWKETDR